MTAWIGLIGALAGVLLAKLLEKWDRATSYRREQGARLNSEARGRLEEAYTLIEKHRQAVTGIMLQHVTRLLADTPLGTIDKLPWEDLKMRTALYLPALLPNYKQLVSAYEPFGKAVGMAMLHASGSTEQRTSAVAGLRAAHEALVPAYDSFQEAVQEHFAKHSARLLEGN